MRFKKRSYTRLRSNIKRTHEKLSYLRLKMDEKQERRQLSSRRGNQSDADIREHCSTACDIQLSSLTCQGKLLFTETSANLRNITLHMAGYRVPAICISSNSLTFPGNCCLQLAEK